jgi:hypothetical protein
MVGLICLPEHVLKANLLPFLTLRELCTLDTATLSRAYRAIFLNSLNNMHYSVYQVGSQNCLEWFFSSHLTLRRFIVSNHVEISLTCSKICLLMKPLTQLEFLNCPTLKNTDIKLLTEHCQLITRFGVPNCAAITNDASSYFRNLPHLTSIDISDNSRLTDASLFSISEGCPNLKELDIHKCVKMTANGVNQILSCCKNLVSFNTADCPMINPVPVVLQFNQGLYGSDPNTQLSRTRTFRQIIFVCKCYSFRPFYPPPTPDSLTPLQMSFAHTQYSHNTHI